MLVSKYAKHSYILINTPLCFNTIPFFFLFLKPKSYIDAIILKNPYFFYLMYIFFQMLVIYTTLIPAGIRKTIFFTINKYGILRIYNIVTFQD